MEKRNMGVSKEHHFFQTVFMDDPSVNFDRQYSNYAVGYSMKTYSNTSWKSSTNLRDSNSYVDWNKSTVTSENLEL